MFVGVMTCYIPHLSPFLKQMRKLCLQKLISMTPNFRPCRYHGIKLDFGRLTTESRILAHILIEIEDFTLEQIQIHRMNGREG